ncbi:MAG: hypothetical protein BZY80_01430 [SAR202 cluster bacterium Io17-Chloro-G2]|nr:MAG: hypothetical protein BZY80_01430 [SAR202 cluster bacterium Io17-Chloro-G2]
MADADSRLETVEDELKVLKGEVRRTLVDLRALLMRADSPMNDGFIGRRDALPDREPEDGPKPARTEMSQVIQQETGPALAAAPAPAPAQPPAAAPAPAPVQPLAGGPGQPPVGGPGQPPGGLFPPGSGPQQGSINSPVMGPPIATPNGEQERAMAEQQRRMADQERRIAEQDRQMADLSRMVQEGAQAAEQAPGQDPEQQHRLDEQQRQIADQSQQMPAMDGKLDEQGGRAEGGTHGNDEERDHREPEQIQQIADLKVRVEEEGRSTREAVAEAQITSQPPSQRRTAEPENQIDPDDVGPKLEEEIDEPSVQGRDDESDRYQENIQTPRRTAGRREEIANRQRGQRTGGGRDVGGLGNNEAWDKEPIDKERHPSGSKPDGVKRPRPVITGSNDIVGNHYRNSGHDDVEDQYRGESGSHVYDQYHQLFEAIGGAGGVDDNAGNSAPLDVNLLASLVRWMTLAKGRVGEARLKRILDLYLGSGRSSPQLRELLVSVSSMVDTVSPETPQAAQECTDLLSQLHGILTGGLQIAQVPQISLSE